jgi:hypothetical protein
MTDLMTVTQYKELKGKSLTNTNEDTRIGKLIESVSTAIKEYIGRSLIDYYSDYKVEYKKGTVSNFFVSEWPIKDTEIVVAYKTSAGYVDLQEDIDFYVDAEIGKILSANGNNFAADSVRDPKFLRVTYMGGFETCPTDILMAMADYVEKALKQEHSIQKNMGGQDIMNFPITPLGRLPTHIAVVLDTYRVPLL